MADSTPSKPVEAASAAPGERRAAPPPRPRPRLARASESGDAGVQKLLGDRHTAEQNLAAARNENLRDPDAEASLASVNAQLAELGFE